LITHNSPSHSSRGWSDFSLKHVGKQICFLDPGRNEYPVCGRLDKPCQGILMAHSRAAQQGRTDLVDRANKMAQQQQCAWAVTRRK
jgi:hypothetical protein